MNKQTSWGEVAKWYDDLLNYDDNSYQKNVILPNIIRLVEPKPEKKILDLACGQGYFSSAFAEKGALVIGCDISDELITLAKTKLAENKNLADKLTFHTTPSDKLDFATNNSFDVVTVILALQNIENISGTLAECVRVLKPSGKLFVVINHPAFRIPQASSWQWDDKANTQYRRIDAYMSEKEEKIDMNPGEKSSSRKKFTITFHRPLQYYFKALNKTGFAITRLEEWISHRKSDDGPRAKEEDRTRKEIPLFMMIECEKL